MTFDEIISTISEQQMINLIKTGRPASKDLHQSHIMSADEQRLNLAFYAKATHEHIGWNGFSEQNRQSFMQNIEQLYASISAPCPQNRFIDNLFAHTGQYIEDRHFSVNNHHGGSPKPERSVGRNFAKLKDKPFGYQCLSGEYKQDGAGQDIINEDGTRCPIWEIGIMKAPSGEDILVVSIPDFNNRSNTYEDWQQFIEKFDDIYLNNQQKWEQGRIILDVRNNKGGEDKPIDHIAKRLYGNLINTYKRCEIRDTPLSNAILHTHGAYKEENYSKDGIRKEDLLTRRHFSGKIHPLFDETDVYYPFNPERGFKGRLDILLDRDVGSSAESAYTSFYHHPNTRYIGENTAGMQQYTQGTFYMPCGSQMRVGVTRLTYYDKEGENIEVKGHKPDIDCAGYKYDAMAIALSIPRDEGRVAKRETNEPLHGKEIYAEYVPQATADTRKAYYARTLEQGLKRIETANLALFNNLNRHQNR